MHSPDKILDLIEATEVSAERLNYKFSEQQTILIHRLKSKAEKGMKISNNYWELLCDLYNEVENRPKRNDLDDGFSSIQMLVYYVFIPILFLAVCIIFVWAYALIGGAK